MFLTICHSPETGWQEVRDVSRVSEMRRQAETLLWAEADVSGLTEREIGTIAEEFGLHPLAVEDAIHTKQRPKIDMYQSHIFVVFHQLNEVDGQLEAVQLACFLGNDYLLTIHAGANRTIDEAKRRWSDSDEGMPGHPSFLLHTLMDVVVDEYQVYADALENQMEDLEETVLADPSQRVQQPLYSVKQRVARLRRYVLPESRMLDWAVNDNLPNPLPDATAHLFADVEDHLLRIGDQIRNVDELAQAVLDLTHTEQAQRLNEVNRMLAAWAAIFAVGTLIAGVYGMNFELYPFEGSRGFWFAIGLTVLSSLGLWFNFKRRGWL
jgi:magnesium transporter